MTKLKDIVLVIFSSFLLILAFPKFDISFFAWIAFVPFFYVIKNQQPVKAFFTGWIFGSLFFLGGIYWVINTMINYGHIPVAVSLMILVIFSLYLGLFFGLFSYMLSYLEARIGVFSWYLSPFVWVATELLRTYIIGGFPWILLGYSQYRNLEIIQASDVTGVYGISFIILLVNTAVFLILTSFGKREEIKSFFKANKGILTYSFITALLLICVYIYGKKRVGDFNNLTGKNHDKKKIAVVVVQGNIEQDVKWKREYQEGTVKEYLALTDEAVNKKKADLIIWPETATPFYLQNETGYLNLLLSYLKGKEAYLLTGSPAFDNKTDGTAESFNSAFLLSPDFRIAGRYDKIHLVPFGEFVPFERFLKINLFKDIIGDIGSFSSGRDETVFAIPSGRFGTLICYEIIFPELTRRFIRNGGEFLVTITNDAWFGKSSAPYQHFAMAVFRAVENKVYVARAANTGISGFINPVGKITGKTEIFVNGYLRGEIYPSSGKTFYTLYGDIFAWLCFLISSAVFLYCKAKKKNCLL